MNKPAAWKYNDNNLEPNTITFNNVNSNWVMQITADRKIIVNEDIEVSKAAQAVLDAMQPLLLKASPVKEYKEPSVKEIDDLWLSVINNIPANDNRPREWHFARAILRKAQEK